MKPGTFVRVKRDSGDYKFLCHKIGGELTVVLESDEYKVDLEEYVTIRVKNGYGNASTLAQNTYNTAIYNLELCANVKKEDFEDSIKLMSL